VLQMNYLEQLRKGIKSENILMMDRVYYFINSSYKDKSLDRYWNYNIEGERL
jgi:hypothetical protein